MTRPLVHPRDALRESAVSPPALPVCDHYCGVEARMRKSLKLQAELGPVFDVTLDCEDGAPVGGESEHARMAAAMAASSANRYGRVGARVHPVRHPSFADDIGALVRGAGQSLAYLMLPKPEDFSDVERACNEIDHQLRINGIARRVPVHALIETHGALRDVDAIAGHPRVESLSFGLMDFVSAHRGAIPSAGMSAAGQFSHPLVLRAKLEISAACHAHAKVPAHCVVTEFDDLDAVGLAARKAATELGYLRMWSIHPDQIRPIVAAFSPSDEEVAVAAEIVAAGQDADWAPIRHRVGGRDSLHDGASYRFFWQLLERARLTGRPVPAEAQRRFFEPATAG